MDRLPFFFMPSAGWIKTPKLVREIVAVPLITHVVMGSFTVQKRDPRGGGTDFDVLRDGAASNNLGLPNGGVPYLKTHGREMVRIAHDHGKEVIFSGAPFSPEDDDILATIAFAIGADSYESNRGCPNTEAEIISYDLEMMQNCNEAVAQAIGSDPWRVKISPYVNPRERERHANLIIKSTACGAVAANTIPSGRLRRDGKPIITANGTNGLGGISGTAIKYLNLVNAEHFSELLAPHGKNVIGAGGISDGDDLNDYILAGCAGGQVGAALFQHEEPGVLDRIAKEWAFRHAE